MKRINQHIKLLLFSVLIIIYSNINCQIIIESGPNVTPEDLVENILGEGIQYSNVQFIGAELAKGIFTNGSLTNLGIESGIILSTGMAIDLQGPNTSYNTSTNFGLIGPPWNPNAFDPAILAFDFIPESDTLRMKYVFGSEEYNEYVGATFTDSFEFLVSGPDPLGGSYNSKYIAIVPGTGNVNVTINNVNNGYATPGVVPTGPCEHCEYYTDNTFGTTLEYDGFTTVLVAWLLVVPCEEYHISFEIFDEGDGIYDSGFAIEENSFEIPKIEVETDPFPQGVSDNIIEGCVEADIIFRLPNPEYAPITVCYEITGTATNYVDYGEIPGCVTFEEGVDSAVIHINAYHDGIIEGEETIILIIENTLGCIVRYDTVEFIIIDYVDMVTATSPNTMICQGQEIDIWVQTVNGIPPYTYSWEPEPSENDTITVSPEDPGEYTYTVTITDLCMDTVVDSTSITVFPVCELETFYFVTYLNPGLLYDVFGDVTGDSVFIVFPPGTNLNALIPSYTFSNEECSDTVGMITDFTEPIVYQFFGPGGCMSEWIVIADVEVGQNERLKNEIQIFPNPARDQLTILNANGFSVSLISNVGTEVYAGKIDKQQQTIYINHLEQGVYYLQFSSEKDWLIRKVIINQ